MTDGRFHEEDGEAPDQFDESRSANDEGRVYGSSDRQAVGDDPVGSNRPGAQQDFGFGDVGADSRASRAARHPKTGGGPILRNFLVATATIPFVFLLVLIASIFVLGGGESDEQGLASTDPVRLPIAPMDAKYDQDDATLLSLDEEAPKQSLAEASPQTSTGLPIGEANTLLISPNLTNFQIDLPVEGVVRSVGLDGDRIALLVESADGAVVVVYDVTQGRALAELPVNLSSAAKVATTRPIETRAPITERDERSTGPSVADVVVDEDGDDEEAGELFSARPPSLKSFALTVERARREFDRTDDPAVQPGVTPAQKMDDINSL